MPLQRSVWPGARHCADFKRLSLRDACAVATWTRSSNVCPAELLCVNGIAALRSNDTLPEPLNR